MRKKDRNYSNGVHLMDVSPSALTYFSELAQEKKMSVEHYLSFVLNDLFWNPDGQKSGKSTNAVAKVNHVENHDLTKYKGVHAYGKKFAAVRFIDGVRTRLGVYETPVEAAKAVDLSLTRESGDPTAAVNFPIPGRTVAEEAWMYAHSTYLTPMGKPRTDHDVPDREPIVDGHADRVAFRRHGPPGDQQGPARMGKVLPYAPPIMPEEVEPPVNEPLDPPALPSGLDEP